MDIKSKIIDYVSGNIIISSYFIFLLFGGLIFFVYYLDIQYLPDFNLISSVTLLAITSFTGLVLVFSTIIMFIYPAMFWRDNVCKDPKIVNIWSENNSKDKSKNISSENRLHTLWQWFLLSIVFVYGSLFLLFLLNNHWVLTINLAWIILLFGSGLKNRKDCNISLKEYFLVCLKFIYLSLSISIISFIPISILSLLFLGEYNKTSNFFLVSLLTLIFFILLTNLLAIALPKNTNQISWYFILGLISFLIVTIFTGQGALFPKTIMKTYKLGNIEASSVIINKQGCKTINKSMKFHQVKNSLNGKIIQFEIEDDSCIIPNVNILSKLGKESYIEFDKISVKIEEKEATTMRFVIPSSSIITYNLIN